MRNALNGYSFDRDIGGGFKIENPDTLAKTPTRHPGSSDMTRMLNMPATGKAKPEPLQFRVKMRPIKGVASIFYRQYIEAAVRGWAGQFTPDDERFELGDALISVRRIWRTIEAVEIAELKTVKHSVNAERIAACVNACAGIDTDNLKDGSVKELVAATELLLKTAQHFERQASQGTGGRRGGPVFTRVRAALANFKKES